MHFSTWLRRQTYPGHGRPTDRRQTRRISRRDYCRVRWRPGAGIGPRRGDLPTRRWIGGELSYLAKPPSSGTARVANRRTLLETRRSQDAAPRYFVLRCRHLRAQHQRALEHADRVRAARWSARRRVALAAKVGCGMRRAFSLAAILL